MFSNPDPNLNSRDFKLRVVEPPKGYKHVLKKVVLAERLREVRSLIGFTRIESPGDYSELSNLPEEKHVPLSVKPPSWVPTSVVRGEGVFLHSQRGRHRSLAQESKATGRGVLRGPPALAQDTRVSSPTTMIGLIRPCGTFCCTPWHTP